MPSPQPWEVRSRFIRGKHRPRVEIHAPTHRVATLNPTDRPKKTAGTIYDDAAILAAAPDLLAQLRAFVDFANEWFGEGKMPEDWKGRCVCANAAINKAATE